MYKCVIRDSVTSDFLLKHFGGILNNFYIKLLIMLLFTTSTSREIGTSCTAPAVSRGQNTTVACHFTSSIQNEEGYRVYLYSSTDSIDNPDVILRCDKDDDNTFDCSVKGGYAYTYSPTQSVSIRVEIKSAGVQNEGRYECTTLAQDPWTIQPCTFTLNDEKPTPPTFSPKPPSEGSTEGNATTGSSLVNEERGLSAVLAVTIGVAVVALVVGVVGIVVLIICKKRKCFRRRFRRRNAEETPEAPNAGQQLRNLLPLVQARPTI